MAGLLSIVLALAIGALHVGAGVALFVWARRIASSGVRRATRLLIALALVFPFAGVTITIIALVAGLATEARVDAATRATTLAVGISEALNATACSMVSSVVLYVSIAIIIATLTRRHDEPRRPGGS